MQIITTILSIAAVAVILYILFKVFKLLTRIIIIAVFLLIAYFTNPGIKKHENAVHAKNSKINISNRVSIKDLKVASLTQLKTKGEIEVVGMGAFTRVWIFRDMNK